MAGPAGFLRTDRYGFVSGTLVAGVTIQTITATTAAQAVTVLWTNPAGSGVIGRIKTISMGNHVVPVAVEPMVIGVQSNPTNAATVTTAATVVTIPFGASGSNKCTFAYSGTITFNGASKEFFDANYYLNNFATAVGWQPGIYEFNDELICGPNTNVVIYNNYATLASTMVTFVWEEYALQAI
jgi:hypothetical protein